MQTTPSTNPMPPLPPDLKIGIVGSSYYEDLVDAMKTSAIETLKKNNVTNIESRSVAGAFEIPLMCKKLIEEESVDGVIALGVIVQGETHHAQEISRGCTEGVMKVQIDTNTPIAHAVLFVDDIEHAKARAMGKWSKGQEAADVLLRTIASLKKN